MLNLKSDLEKNKIGDLKAGQWVQLSGELIVMRDAAHKRLLSGQDLEKIKKEIAGKIIFYAGPTSGLVKGKGVIGPTTSSRMDMYVESMLKLGVRGFLGKGPREKKVAELLKKYQAVYFVTVGGAAAYLSQFVEEAEIIAYEDLGPEAIYRLNVEGFPAMVAIDSEGNSIW